jgi:hypothetical protein
MSRRDFLRRAGKSALVLGATAGAVYAENKYGLIKKVLDQKKEKSETGVHYDTSTEIERDISREDIQRAEEALDPLERRPIRINKEISDGIEEYWYRQYKKDNPKLAVSLEKAYIEMQPYVPQLEKIFIREGVPKEYIYLAIPESHWDLQAKSHARAVGPYQFMKSTAVKAGLIVNDKVDERTDPIKSAQACAKNLKYLFDKTGNWDTALAGYNGGFIWQYLRKDIVRHFGKTYDGFLTYLQWNINSIKEYIPKNRVWWHKVKEGQTAESIMKFYGIDHNLVSRENKSLLKKKGKNWELSVAKGDLLRFPITEQDNKKKVYQSIKRGVAENLNYPPKFNAVMRIIKESDFLEKMRKKMEQRTMTAGRR